VPNSIPVGCAARETSLCVAFVVDHAVPHDMQERKDHLLGAEVVLALDLAQDDLVEHIDLCQDLTVQNQPADMVEVATVHIIRVAVRAHTHPVQLVVM